MSEKELNQYYYLKKKVDDLNNRLAKLGYGISSMKFTDDPKGTTIPSSVQEKIVELQSQLIEARISALEKYIEIEQYINSIDNPEVEMIARYRFLDNKSWNEIADLLCKGDKYISEDAPRKKLKRYLKSQKN